MYQLWRRFRENYSIENYPTGESTFGAFKLTVIGLPTPALYGKVVRSPNADYQKDSSEYWKHLKPGDIVGPDFGRSENCTHYSDKYTAYAVTTRENCAPRQLFITSKGYIGLGPHILKTGDVIVFLPGVIEPLVLRKMDECYKLVGTCYIQGVKTEGELNSVRINEMPTQELQIS